jgi:hypothetical protein
MNWQDYILGIGNLVLAAGLLPSLLSKNKPDIKTSIISGTVLAAFGFTFASLELWLSAVAVTIAAMLWFVLAYQKSR